MSNMKLYELFKDTPQEAQKPIEGGRLKGFTDINPMWRFKRLTEVFGACGYGWKYEVTNTNIVPGANNEFAAFVEILLFYRLEDGKWSDGIPGFGGSMFVSKESGGLHTSDECFKMALSDAIGTACKALGMSADIYFSNIKSKYTSKQSVPDTKMETVEDAAGYVLGFGKHKGKTLGELYKTERNYIIWLHDNDKTDPIVKKGIEILLQAALRAKAANGA